MSCVCVQGQKQDGNLKLGFQYELEENEGTYDTKMGIWEAEVARSKDLGGQMDKWNV